MKTRTRHHNQVDLYVDANFGDESLKSNTGYIIMLNDNIIKYKSKKQSLTAKSTTEAEFIALETAVADLECICHLLKELKLTNDNTLVKIHCDNKPAIDAVMNVEKGNIGRTKH